MLCRCLSLAGLKGQEDSDWIADHGVFCLGEFLNNLATAFTNASKTFHKIVNR